MQPNIFMWGGLLKSIIDSDLHIVLDVVKSSKNSRYNRNKIAGEGNEAWLTIPFIDFKREKRIMYQNLDTSALVRNNLVNFFKNRYSKTTYYKNSLEILISTLEVDINKSNLCLIYKNFLNALKNFGLPICDIKFASDLIKIDNKETQVKGIDLVNNLLRQVNAKTYLGSENTLNYASADNYDVSEVLIQKFSAQEYLQIDYKKNKFIPNLSLLDMVSYLKKDEILKNLENSNSWEKQNI